MQRPFRPPLLAIVALVLASPMALAASPKPDAHHAPVDLNSPAAQLRVDLDRLLAEHAFLTIEQMRSGLTNAPDFAASAAAVEANSTDIAAAIGAIYGAAAVEPFGEIWRSHIGYLVDYSISLGRNDAAGRAQALNGLGIYRQKLKGFLTAANPGIDLGEITEALDMHTAQLLEFIDTEHAGDHVAAYAIERTAYPHMFDIGDALAKLIANKFPKRFTGLGVAYSAAGTLRVTLDRLLAEHAFLAAEAMRSGVAGAPDYESAKGAINANSSDLQAVVAAAYGARAAATFRTLWDGHITAYVSYIDARRTSNQTATTQATNQVTTYAGQLAGFLAGANPFLDPGELSTMFQEHAGHLMGQVDAFVADDFEGTYRLVRTAYTHMFAAGEAIAIGIATQMPDRFPSKAKAPDTATLPGPRGEASNAPAVIIALVVSFTVVFALVVVERRTRIARGQRRDD
jgi:hypothetical protein